MGFQFSDRSQELQLRITKFLDDHIYPAEEVYAQQMQEFTEQGDRWQIPQIIEDKNQVIKTYSRRGFFFLRACERRGIIYA